MTTPIYDPGRSAISGDGPKPSMQHSYLPNQLVMEVKGATIDDTKWMATAAVLAAKLYSPKLTGRTASQLYPVFWDGYFGIAWTDDYVWFQNQGIRPFTMTKLAGKVVPMWVDDPDGKTRAANPKAKTRTTGSGKVQVLIFRKAAKKGERKIVRRRVGGVMREVSVPRSYPGAPGRIKTREAARPFTAPGKVGGRIAERNVGVRWRHPGLPPREYLQRSLRRAVEEHGFEAGEIMPIRSHG